MAQLSPDGLAFIQHFEGFSSVCYRDVAGYETIGYGHLLKPGETEKYTNGIGVTDALGLLRQDVSIAEQAIIRLITIELTQNQFDALVSFTFNLGSAVLQRSTLRRVVNRGDHADVPHQLMRYVWAGGRKLSSLLDRRKAEAKLYKNL